MRLTGSQAMRANASLPICHSFPPTAVIVMRDRQAVTSFVCADMHGAWWPRVIAVATVGDVVVRFFGRDRRPEARELAMDAGGAFCLLPMSRGEAALFTGRARDIGKRNAARAARASKGGV